MSRWHHLVFFVGTLFLVSSPVGADQPRPVWLEPSKKWHGIDGNWSSTRLFVGEPAQEVDVFVSTSLSEIWVPENSICGVHPCNALGGVFNRSASKSWSPMGLWQLGLGFCGVIGNGDYGMETIAVHDIAGQPQASFGQLLVAGINDTAAYSGFFGLGISKGNFDTAAQGPIASLVGRRGLIPSYSYGYTAGAYYAGANGAPMSLTLGGYDANRFKPHDVQFSLNAATRQPQVQIQEIRATVSDLTEAPTEWSTPSMVLSSLNESLPAIIDSSTPYLWLPQAICDRFASALNLTWNETFELYTFSSPNSLEQYSSAPGLSFSFALSGLDSNANARLPANVSGTVNITISANAFVQSLQYPFKNLDFGAPAIPYFPLKRTGTSNQLIIGRSFLQEAYIITNYETNMFSVHEARFPSDPWTDLSIQTISPPPNSPYPRPNKRAQPGTISHTQIAGAVVGACLGLIGIIAVVVLVQRKRRAFKDDGSGAEEFSDKCASSESDCPVKSTSVPLFPRRFWRQNKTRENLHPNEKGTRGVGVDRDHEIHKLPAPSPVELEASNNITSAYFAVPVGDYTYDRDSYSHPQRLAQFPHTKAPDDFSRSRNDHNWVTYLPQSGHTYYGDYASPASSPTHEYDVNGAHSPIIPSPIMASPITPAGDAPIYSFGGYQSPMADFYPAGPYSHLASSPTTAHTPSSPIDVNHSIGPVGSASSAASACSRTPFPMPPPLIQRTPIDSIRVLCLGPLPENVQLPHQLMMQNPWGTQDLHDPDLPASPEDDGIRSRPASIAETLGSNYTLEEEARIAAKNDDMSLSERIDGHDIVHIPQVVHQRFSWEAEA